MASLPAPQASQRRSNQTQAPQSQTPTAPVRRSSQESQTIFNERQGDQSETRERQQYKPSPATDDDGESEKKCWICFSDSSEDTPDTSPWRDPCPCALVAHEECLLDWIADMEAPKNSRNRSVTAPKIECPQCKSEIKLARPTNYIVDAVRSFERIGAKIVTPGAIMTLCGVVYSSSMAWGAHSIYAVFGAEDGFRILRPIIYNATRAPVEVYVGSPSNAAKQLLAVMMDHLVHWRLYVGLPLITPVLILSRTNFADGILPVLPIVFFASQTPPNGVIDFGQWPPSASFVFALLPYVRSIYNTYYERVWADKERRWLREIQPRAGQTDNEGGGDAEGGNDAGNDEREEEGNVFELQIHAPIWDVWEEDDDNDVPPPQMGDNAGLLPPEVVDAIPPPAEGEDEEEEEHRAQPIRLPPYLPQNPPQPQDQPQAQAQPQLQAQPQPQLQQPQQPQQAPQPQDRRLSFSPTAIAETILGALIFPTVAGLTGEALRLILPSSWTTISAAVSSASSSPRFGGRPVPRGLLQQKWGRTVVGGCLFVVCKDALMLYVRWKMAQMHRRRRVVDYDRGKDKGRK